MPYINKKEWNALHDASGQISDLLERGAQDRQYYDGIIEGLQSIIEKVKKEDSARSVRHYVKKILKEKSH